MVKFLQKRQKIKKLNKAILLLVLIFILYIIIITINYLSYLNKFYESEKKVVFYQFYFMSQNFLNEIFKEYNKIYSMLPAKWLFVVKNVDKNLTVLKKQLGSNYHIFITDKNFVIRDTTFKYDKNFSLAFAKDLFYKYQNQIRVSPPICEPATTNFFTYAYRLYKGKVYQVGYILSSKKISDMKEKLRELKSKYPFIKDISLFFIHPQTNYAQECKILTPLYRKYTLDEMIKIRKFGIKIYKKLLHNNPLIGKKVMYILGQSPFNNISYIIFELKLDDIFLKNKIEKIIFFSILISLILILVSLIIYFYINKILKYLDNFTTCIKEEKLCNQMINNELDEVAKAYNHTLNKLHDSIKSKEDFTHFAMHEFATPLNILSLHIDDYKELKPAIKKLLTAYKNLSYVNKESNDIEENVALLSISDILRERINFFKDIIEIENIKIYLEIKNDVYMMGNKEDIETLIDNNIKNAIKYSEDKNVVICLKDNILFFENKGKIVNKNKLFEKFYRENSIKGGFGLGFFIIKHIADKYDIKINILEEKNKVRFEYIFKDDNESSNN